MLEGVQIDIAFAQRFVRQHVVVEGHQFNVQTVFLFRHFLSNFSHLLLSADDHADLDVVWILFIPPQPARARVPISAPIAAMDLNFNDISLPH